MKDERGMTVGPVVGIVLIILAIIGLFAVCTEDEDDLESHRIEWVSHDYDDGWGGGSDGNSGGEYEGGRSGDQGDGAGQCRNFCNITVPDPTEPDR